LLHKKRNGSFCPNQSTRPNSLLSSFSLWSAFRLWQHENGASGSDVHIAIRSFLSPILWHVSQETIQTQLPCLFHFPHLLLDTWTQKQHTEATVAMERDYTKELDKPRVLLLSQLPAPDRKWQMQVSLALDSQSHLPELLQPLGSKNREPESRFWLIQSQLSISSSSRRTSQSPVPQNATKAAALSSPATRTPSPSSEVTTQSGVTSAATADRPSPTKQRCTWGSKMARFTCMLARLSMIWRRTWGWRYVAMLVHLVASLGCGLGWYWVSLRSSGRDLRFGGCRWPLAIIRRRERTRR